jgi:hypothetical protein
VNVRLVLPLLSSLLLVSVAAPLGVVFAEDAPPTVREIIERWRTDDGDIRSFYSVPFSERREARAGELGDRVEAEAGTLLLDDALTLDERVDVVLLTDHLQQARAQREWSREQDARAAPLLPFAAELLALETSRRGLETVDPRAAAGTLESAHAAIKAVRKRLDTKKEDADALAAPPHIALRAARSVDAVKRSVAAWFTYRDGYEPEFGWWVRKPYRQLDKALGEYAKHLREKVAGQKGPDAPLVGEPIGAEALSRSLRHERIPYSAAELIAIAERHFEWCEEEGRKASEEMGLGGDWHAAVEKVKGLHVAPGEMDDLVTAQSREAIEFVTSRNLVSVPELCAEMWRLDMISEQGQKTLPFAAYSGNRMLVAYPTEGMAHETKVMSLRGNNQHFSRLVVPHELIPGHHLQGFYAARHNTHRAPFRTPFLVEGWALYWEMRLWEQGWAQGPEDRIGMLFWRKHRCARVIVSLRFHLGTMTTEEMIEFLMTRVGLEKDGATAEVRRYVGGGYGPLYQAAYLIGGLQMRALHREAVESGRMTEEAFHELVLRQGSIPIDLIRARVLEMRVDGAPPAWRFAD